MSEWMKWTDVDYATYTHHEWVGLSYTVGYGWVKASPPPKGTIHWMCSSDDLANLLAAFNAKSSSELPGWEVIDPRDGNKLLAGPFDSLDAAKAAYLMMFSPEGQL